jgi:hypothetical protein
MRQTLIKTALVAGLAAFAGVAFASDIKTTQPKAPMSMIVAITSQELVCTNKCGGQRGGCGSNSAATRKCYNACMGKKVCPEN